MSGRTRKTASSQQPLTSHTRAGASATASMDAFTEGPACPTCKAHAGTRQQNKAFPFCSARCRQIDLGKWLGESYAIPEGAPPISELMQRKKG